MQLRISSVWLIILLSSTINIGASEIAMLLKPMIAMLWSTRSPRFPTSNLIDCCVQLHLQKCTYVLQFWCSMLRPSTFPSSINICIGMADLNKFHSLITLLLLSLCIRHSSKFTGSTTSSGGSSSYDIAQCFGGWKISSYSHQSTWRLLSDWLRVL